jgi:transketolase
MEIVDIKDLEKKAVQIRLDALMAIHKAGVGYTGSCMSVVEMLVALYYGKLGRDPVMKYDPCKPGWDGQDYVVLSKGQAVPVQYAILADLGFFDKSELDYIGKGNSLLKNRPDFKIPGITASVSVPGHGLSIASGIALSLKMDRRDNKVYAILGDGELQSGQVWEAAISASDYNLNNLVVFIDNNEVQKGGSIQDKFEAFGWNVVQVMDGHNFDGLFTALERAFTSNRKPVCIWCHTVSGKGIDFAERKPGYLKTALSDGEMSVIIPKLKQLL